MSQPWRYIVAEPLRTELLTEYGIPDRVIALGAPDPPHDSLRERCQPPHRSSDEQSRDGRLVVGICETEADEVLACRRADGGLEFVSFDAEGLHSIRVVASSVQGLLAHLFFELVEADLDGGVDDPQTTLGPAAEAVGFKHLAATHEFVLEERTRGLLGWQRRLLDFCNSLPG